MRITLVLRLCKSFSGSIFAKVLLSTRALNSLLLSCLSTLACRCFLVNFSMRSCMEKCCRVTRSRSQEYNHVAPSTRVL
jgi:hypothetical protein